jgi:hypothetical protein
MGTARRSFVKAGACAALALAAGGILWRVAFPPAAPQRFTLDGEARAALDAIIPAMLAGALPSDPAQRTGAVAATIGRVQQAILGLPLSTQNEVQDLFALLGFGPARRYLAGVPGSWSSASAEQVGAFLQDWRLHRFGLQRSAYQALHGLVLGAWYAAPSSWAAIGYPGPIAEIG